MGQAGRSRTTGGRLVAAMAALALALAVGACGDDDDDASSSDTTASSDAGSGGGDATLDVTSFNYTDVSAPAGGTLEVINESGGAHTVTADDGEFDVELPDGETVEVPVPSEPGSYGFHCEIHPSMTATLTAE
jgi:plastocyanin